MFLLWPRQLPQWGNRTPASVPPPAQGGFSPSNTFFPLVPSSCRVLRESVYSFPLVRSSCPLSDGVLHACTSASEAVFLMYPWRETYSTSTYSSAILFSPLIILVLMAFLYLIIIQKSLLYQEKHFFKYKIYCEIYVSLKNKYTV